MVGNKLVVSVGQSVSQSVSEYMLTLSPPTDQHIHHHRPCVPDSPPQQQIKQDPNEADLHAQRLARFIQAVVVVVVVPGARDHFVLVSHRHGRARPPTSSPGAAVVPHSAPPPSSHSKLWDSPAE